MGKAYDLKTGKHVGQIVSKKDLAKKMKVVKREALVGGKKTTVKGYKDPVSGLVHPSKDAYKDRYQTKQETKRANIFA